jgi:hypothetical protein
MFTIISVLWPGANARLTCPMGRPCQGDTAACAHGYHGAYSQHRRALGDAAANPQHRCAHGDAAAEPSIVMPKVTLPPMPFNVPMPFLAPPPST